MSKLLEEGGFNSLASCGDLFCPCWFVREGTLGELKEGPSVGEAYYFVFNDLVVRSKPSKLASRKLKFKTMIKADDLKINDITDGLFR